MGLYSTNVECGKERMRGKSFSIKGLNLIVCLSWRAEIGVKLLSIFLGSARELKKYI